MEKRNRLDKLFQDAFLEVFVNKVVIHTEREINRFVESLNKSLAELDKKLKEYALDRLVKDDLDVFNFKLNQEATATKSRIYEELNKAILQIENNPHDEEAIFRLMREFHGIKGSAKVVKLEDVSHIAHALEDIYTLVKENKLKLTKDIIDLTLQTMDVMREMVSTAIEGRSCSIDPKEVIENLTNAKLGKPFKKLMFESQKTMSESIRIDIGEIDHLVDIVSEMLIQRLKFDARNQELQELNKRFYLLLKKFKKKELAIEEFEKLTNELQQFARKYSTDIAQMNLTINELESKVLELRMLPISLLFDPLGRNIHDIARELKKEVKIVIKDNGIKLDKRMIEELYDPLIHIVRNSIDHGIEPPEERKKLGKPAQGTITFVANRSGDFTYITIMDDGRGIDIEKVKLTALRQGIVLEEELERMTEEEILNLIFKPGFSTRKESSEISGRGVGLDVVYKKVVNGLRGRIIVKTKKGQGTEFTLKIPVALSIIRALLVKIENDLFAVPTVSMKEALIVTRDQIKTLGETEIIERDSRNIPIVYLKEFLGLGHMRAQRRDMPCVIVKEEGSELALIVDDLLDENEIIIKPLPVPIKKVPNISGVSLLGTGEIVCILNIAELVSHARGGIILHARRIAKKRILVVEDAFTVREYEKEILEQLGYEVVTARDGEEAKEILELEDFDLVVTDICMPKLDGFELTKWIKNTRNLPVVIVTDRDTDADVKRGMEVGADAYLKKGELNADKLGDVINSLIG